MNASTRFDTEVIGSLPILIEYLDRLKLAETIDKVVPWEGDVPLGTLTEVLVLNRLLNPKAMFRIDAWAQTSGIAAYYGLHAAFDGNTAESTTYAENVRRLKEILPKSDLLYIADTKLDTEENLWEVVDAKGKFLCGGAFNVSLQKRFLKNYKELQPIKYWPKSQEKWDPEERDQYQAFELTDHLERIVNGKKQKHDYRVLFVWSESKERQEIKTRERHVAKIRAEFEAIERNLNRYTLKDEKTILRRLEKAKGLYSEGSLFDYTLAGKQGSYTLTWSQNAKALAEWKKLEGVFVLKTNMSTRKLSLGGALAKYREQINVEKRIGNLKGPLAVAPMFLEKPERIAGLLSVLVWALMVMSLMERTARKNLKGKPLYGLYPENRPSPAPTGPAILECFSTLCIVIVQHKHTQSRHLAEPNAIQMKLLKLLGIPPSTLKAFKRNSGILVT